MESRPFIELGNGIHIDLVRRVHDWRGVVIYFIVIILMIFLLILINKKHQVKPLSSKKITLISILLTVLFVSILLFTGQTFPEYFDRDYFGIQKSYQ